jgi:hypothetical protein
MSKAIFDDAYGMLVDAVYCEQVLNPMAFDIGKIEATIAESRGYYGPLMPTPP